MEKVLEVQEKNMFTTVHPEEPCLDHVHLHLTTNVQTRKGGKKKVDGQSDEV